MATLELNPDFEPVLETLGVGAVGLSNPAQQAHDSTI
jgi:hypothetical protein